MRKAMKNIWIAATIAVLASMIWFLFGSTGFFTRGLDLMYTVIYIIIWAPALIFVILSIGALKKDKIPSGKSGQIISSVLVGMVAVFFTAFFFYSASAVGWLVPWVEKNGVQQVTDDGRYEYELELINPSQNNSSERLYVKDISAGEEMTIPIDLGLSGIPAQPGIPAPGTQFSREELLWYAWVTLTPSETSPTIYILTTTERLGYFLEITEFEVDIETKTSKKIE